MSGVLVTALLGIAAAVFGAYAGHISTEDRRRRENIWTMGVITIFLILVQMSCSISAQREADKKQADSDHNQNALKQQIYELLRGSSQTVVALGGLLEFRTEVQEQFNDIRRVLKLKPKPVVIYGHLRPPPYIYVLPPGGNEFAPWDVHPHIGIPLPPVQQFRFTERPATSNKDESPFAIQLIIHTDQAVDGPSLTIECSGPISEGRMFVAGVPVMMNVRTTVDGNKFSFSFSFPTVKPETPIVVTLLAKTEIHVVKVTPNQ